MPAPWRPFPARPCWAALISFVKATYLSRRKPDKNLPALKQLAEGVSIQTICAEVEAAFTGQSRLARSIQLYLCQKYGRMKLKDIGAYFGVGESGVCQTARRVTDRMKMDRRLKKDRRDGKTFQIVNNEDLTLYFFISLFLLSVFSPSEFLAFYQKQRSTARWIPAD
jgi:hypothetical protein